MEAVLEGIGGFGRFQKRLLWLCGSISWAFCGAFTLSLPLFSKPAQRLCDNPLGDEKLGCRDGDPLSENDCHHPYRWSPSPVTIVSSFDLNPCTSANFFKSPNLPSSFFFLGFLFGVLIGGRLADRYGRRKMFLGGMTLMLLGGIMSSLAPELYFYCASQLVLAAGLGAGGLPVYCVLCEVVTTAHRVFTVIVVQASFGAGGCLASLAALGLQNWRILFYTLNSLLLLALLYWCSPLWTPMIESPRWLFIQIESALDSDHGVQKRHLMRSHLTQTLYEIARTNDVSPGEITESSLASGGAARHDQEGDDEGVGRPHPPSTMNVALQNYVLSLMSAHLLRDQSPGSTEKEQSFPNKEIRSGTDCASDSNGSSEERISDLNSAACVSEVRPLTQDSPREGSEGDRGGSAQVTERPRERSDGFLDLFTTRLLSFRFAVNVALWFSVSLAYYGVSLSASDFGPSPEMTTFLNGLLEIPAIALGMLAADWKLFKRKGVTSGSLILGGVFGVSCAFIRESPALLLGTALIGRFFIAIAFVAVYLFASELFPSSLRSTAIGTLSMVARLAGIFAPFIVNLGQHMHSLPSLIFGAGAVVSGFLGLLLPETYGRVLEDTIADMRKASGSVSLRTMQQFDKSGSSSQMAIRKGDETVIGRRSGK